MTIHSWVTLAIVVLAKVKAETYNACELAYE